MKLSALFARYLYQHRKLNLPGIGVFSIDSNVVMPDPSDKNFHEFVRQIRYSQQPVAAPDEDFINFIRTETGKIRPLAESDLDSYLSDGKILLNIGKPFHLEGIGYLQKNKAGQYEFTPGEPLAGRQESYHAVEQVDDSTRSTSANSYRNDTPAGGGSRKAIIALSVIVGIALVIWLGYSLYTRNTSGIAPAEDSASGVVSSDTSRANVLLDSVQNIISSTLSEQPAAANNSGTYRFVIERTGNKARAERRFAQIKDNLTDIRMDANADSTNFSLYFVLPASPSDTSRIKDSLRVWYGRKQVWVEKP